MYRLLGPIIVFLLSLSLLDARSLSAQQATMYRVTFESTWSASTHPIQYPSNPHFSGLIGATHNNDVEFWAPGQLSSPGIQEMAEKGKKSPLSIEIDEAIAAGSARALIGGGGLAVSPAMLDITIPIEKSHPLVTLVSMLAPSPDWFVGVHSLSLLDGTEWQERVEVELFSYDAGTDSGISYASPNEATVPHVPVEQLVTEPMLVDGTVRSVARFVFVHTPPVSVAEGGQEFTFGILDVWPNPTGAHVNVSFGLPRTLETAIEVYDLLGRRVATLHDGYLPAGRHEVAGRIGDVPDGIYFVRLSAGDQVEVRSLIRTAGRTH